MSESNQWLGVEIRHLVALDAVLATGSFAQAARTLGYSQPAVSLQIAHLERLAGSRLVERSSGRGPLRATAAGERVRRHARAVLAQMRAAEADLVSLAAGEAGAIAIGTFQTASARLLPGALRRLAVSHPRVEVRLHEGPYEDQLGLVARGELDLALVLLPVDGPFVAVELLRDPFVYLAAVRRGRRPPSRAPGPAALARRRLISWQSGPITIETLLRRRGHSPTVVQRSDDAATVQALVRAGLGVAVMPALALALPDPGLVVLDAGSLLAPRRIGVVRHRDRALTPAARALLNGLRRSAGA